jgi:RNA polymerase sigma-70 factor (ECF subfamily)
LAEIDPSPVIALNRAVAVAQIQGPQAGIQAIEAIPNRRSLESYYLLYAVLGEFELQLNHPEAAASHFRKALALAALPSELAFLSRKLQECETRPPC